MPIAVKLSRAFYDRFGDEIVDELVGMLNQVDAASQNSLRELNEINFARFDDKLERRLGELRTELTVSIARLEATLSAQLVSQMRWMIGILAAIFLAVIGLWFRR